MRPSVADDIFINLVVANFGATAARDVRVTILPEARRSEHSGIETRLLVPVIPVLVPGQQWSTFWDSVLHREEGGFAGSHEATVVFRDSFDEAHSLSFMLDWAHVRRGHVIIYNLHHAAKALRDISSELKRWRART